MIPRLIYLKIALCLVLLSLEAAVKGPLEHENMIGNNSGFYFLASPFNGSDAEKEHRYNLSQKIAVLALENGISLFAPIVWNQTLIKAWPEIELEERRKLLMPMNIDFLKKSKGMLLLKLEGWDTSWGLKTYLDICAKEGIPVYELSLENLEEQIIEFRKKVSYEHSKL